MKMWSLKKKILPSKRDLPMAMKDFRGNILSDKKSILGLYKTEYIQRMSSKPPLPPYKECQLLKNQLFEYRMNISSFIKSKQWNSEDVIKVCRKLKNGKSRDQMGFIYELFKPSVAGPDLMNSLRIIFNKIKDELVIPDFMQHATLTSFY